VEDLVEDREGRIREDPGTQPLRRLQPRP